MQITEPLQRNKKAAIFLKTLLSVAAPHMVLWAGYISSSSSILCLCHRLLSDMYFHWPRWHLKGLGELQSPAVGPFLKQEEGRDVGLPL